MEDVRRGPKPISARCGAHSVTWAITGVSCLLPMVRCLSPRWRRRVVPTLVRSIIDSVTNGVIATQVSKAPAQALPQILPKIGWTQDQFVNFRDNSQSTLIAAGVAILIFAIVRGIFSFLQAYNAEKLSQSMAFDMRNDLFSKIQRLSFSYHDKNQTGHS